MVVPAVFAAVEYDGRLLLDRELATHRPIDGASAGSPMQVRAQRAVDASLPQARMHLTSAVGCIAAAADQMAYATIGSCLSPPTQGQQ